jgi:hypothetical protein
MMTSTYRKMVAARFSTDFRQAAEIVEEAIPELEVDQVLVRNLVAGVNASDIRATMGWYFPGKEPPIDLGAETVGQVAGIGGEVTNLKPGDYVVTSRAGGGYREYAVHKAKHLIPVDAPRPEYLSMIVSGLTATIGLYVTGEMTSGETVLVTAAAGGTGQYAVQLAKLAGNHVIGTCSTEEKAAFLRDLGCDRVINYKQENVGEVLRAEYPKGINLIYECVGGEIFDACVKNLALKGRLVVIGSISEYENERAERVTQPRIYNYLLLKSASVRGMFLPNHYREYSGEHLRLLMDLYQSGKLKIMIDPAEFRGLEAIPDAVEYLHSGRSIGKVVVRLG